jgi:hypothetical protein
MVQIITIPSTGLDHANLQAAHYMPTPEPRHTYRAMLVGLGIVVEDAEGQPVAVEFGATEDLRTVYAQVQGVGFIGGWQSPTGPCPGATWLRVLTQAVSILSSKTCPTAGNACTVRTAAAPWCKEGLR